MQSAQAAIQSNNFNFQQNQTAARPGMTLQQQQQELFNNNGMQDQAKTRIPVINSNNNQRANYTGALNNTNINNLLNNTNLMNNTNSMNNNMQNLMTNNNLTNNNMFNNNSNMSNNNNNMSNNNTNMLNNNNNMLNNNNNNMLKNNNDVNMVSSNFNQAMSSTSDSLAINMNNMLEKFELLKQNRNSNATNSATTFPNSNTANNFNDDNIKIIRSQTNTKTTINNIHGMSNAMQDRFVQNNVLQLQRAAMLSNTQQNKTFKRQTMNGQRPSNTTQASLLQRQLNGPQRSNNGQQNSMLQLQSNVTSKNGSQKMFQLQTNGPRSRNGSSSTMMQLQSNGPGRPRKYSNGAQNNNRNTAPTMFNVNQPLTSQRIKQMEAGASSGKQLAPIAGNNQTPSFSGQPTQVEYHLSYTPLQSYYPSPDSLLR